MRGNVWKIKSKSVCRHDVNRSLVCGTKAIPINLFTKCHFSTEQIKHYQTNSKNAFVDQIWTIADMTQLKHAHCSPIKQMKQKKSVDQFGTNMAGQRK